MTAKHAQTLQNGQQNKNTHPNRMRHVAAWWQVCVVFVFVAWCCLQKM